MTKDIIKAPFHEHYLDCAGSVSGTITLHGTNQFIDREGHSVNATLYDPEFIGKELPSVEGLEWTAHREVPKSEPLDDITSLETFLLLSPRAKELFDQREVTGVQYIPIKLFEHEAANDVDHEEWWYAHVCLSCQPFDLDGSVYKTSPWPKTRNRHMELLASFGPYRVSEIERLELDPTVDLEDVFLVPFPNYAVSQRVYFSSDFAAFLNEGMGKTCTSRFNLNFATRPKPPPAPRGPF